MHRRSRDRHAFSHKVAPCDVCGAIGFGEIIVTCSQCKVTREHLYCMRNNLMEVPEFWLCEICESKNGSTSSCQVQQDSGLPASRRQHFVRKGPLGKVKYLDVDEVVKLSSGSLSMKPTSSRSSLPMSRMASPGSSDFRMTRRDFVASKSVIPKNPSLTRKPNPCISPMAHSKIPRNGVQKNPMTNQRASPSIGPTKENRIVPQRRASAPIPDRKLQPLKVQTLDLQREKPTKGEPCKDLSVNKSSPAVVPDAVAESNIFNTEKSKNQSIYEDVHRDFKYLPSSIHAWSGKFQILQKDASGEFYDGFEAKPPCIVHRKAYLFSKKMPSVLQLESLSASNVLTDIFQNYSPTLQDIALYFFPSENNERSRKNLHRVLKFMNDEKSMMRSFIDGAELLVFTSHQLDENSRGTVAVVHEGHFLWGIFRSTKSDTANKGLPAETDPVDADDDMDIDMVGGNDVGRIDNVVNDNLRSPSQLPFQGTTLESTSSKKVEEKKIKLEDYFEPSSLSPVIKYRKVHDLLGFPPGFKPPGFDAGKPSNIKR
ncbi:uncharacterized protein LOC123917495 [Trifolium pratense]|uniref:Uncharacterized protein n=1 Tax=Trifolium pratense TaxID=57577 RepID=A0ACB0J6C9_TRIPR|nr:uncharacterized protein LOC123917495 [Trifolium pratense]CAJ2639267.1 unnamed protein product [Trifolium pratense]